MGLKRIINLSNIEQGELISWIAKTQAGWDVKMKLYDNRQVYFDERQSSEELEPPLSQGSLIYAGENLSLEIEMIERHDNEYDAIINEYTYTSPQGNVIGHSFTCCVDAGTTHDYNDAYLHVMAWKNKG